MTDFRDSCFGCGGHLGRNVYGASNLCPKCEVRRDAGEIDNFGRPTILDLEPKPIGGGRYEVAA